VWGRPCAIDELTEIAERHNLTLLFDAAHAFACSHRGQMIGGFGVAEVFSFHATKFFNTFEGGAITTNDDQIAHKLRLMRNFGFVGQDQVDYIGTNGKMTEVCAAMGLTSLESLDKFVNINKRNFDLYRSHLADVPGIEVSAYDDGERCNYQYLIVEVDSEKAGIDRDTIVRVLHAENVLARRYFFPGCHQMEPYRTCFPRAGELLQATEGLTQRVMSLPTGTAVGEAEIAGVCRIIRLVVQNSALINHAQGN
jgi:dTDP-4-amino-4,6-dideoxygalactose transaminase